MWVGSTAFDSVLSRHFTGVTEENHNNLSQDRSTFKLGMSVVIWIRIEASFDAV
jgi:hypothetical protein